MIEPGTPGDGIIHIAPFGIMTTGVIGTNYTLFEGATNLGITKADRRGIIYLTVTESVRIYFFQIIYGATGDDIAGD